MIKKLAKNYKLIENSVLYLKFLTILEEIFVISRDHIQVFALLECITAPAEYMAQQQGHNFIQAAG